MHTSSYLKAKFFVEAYLGAEVAGPVRRVLDVGSKSFEGQTSYRDLFPPDRFEYVGLDVEAGHNVSLVPASPYVWSEIASESFDVCISGQTFEHNPFFFVTFAEVARVLKPGGLAMVIAPGGGAVHRYPYDCWRFYPDSWAALCALSGMELVESYFEPDRFVRQVPGGDWRDSAVIARRPVLDAAGNTAFHARIDALTAPFRTTGFELAATAQAGIKGPAMRAYETHVAATYGGRRLRALSKAVRQIGGQRIHPDPDA